MRFVLLDTGHTYYIQAEDVVYRKMWCIEEGKVRFYIISVILPEWKRMRSLFFLQLCQLLGTQN